MSLRYSLQGWTPDGGEAGSCVFEVTVGAQEISSSSGSEELFKSENEDPAFTDGNV